MGLCKQSFLLTKTLKRNMTCTMFNILYTLYKYQKAYISGNNNLIDRKKEIGAIEITLSDKCMNNINYTLELQSNCMHQSSNKQTSTMYFILNSKNFVIVLASRKVFGKVFLVTFKFF